ncbi:MAG: ABC transporter substrate-binding protein [Planctomycetota bacterium]|jgi:iron complex transport system substrate-binding protein
MKPVAVALALCAAACLPSACGDGSTRPTPEAVGIAQRVVIANTSLVDTVTALVPQDRIAAIPQQARTWSFGAAADDSRDDMATFAAFTAETVLGFAPDLVLCSVHSLPETVASLQGAGVRTVRFDFPTGLADVRAQLRQCAALLGAEDRARVLEAELDARIAALRAARDGRPAWRTLLFDHDGNEGWSSAAGTPAHDILTLAGLENAAAANGRTGPVRLSLEQVLALDPDLLVIQLPHGEVDRSTERVLAHELSALRAVRAGHVHRMHPSLFSTTSHEMVRAAETLARAVSSSLDAEDRKR